MKIFFIIIIALVVLLLFSQVAIAVATHRTKQQKYTVLDKDGRFEIRHYPRAIMASVKRTGSFGSVSGEGFRILAGYIFGGNEKRKKISMTAPVRMSQEADQFTMSFVMPPGYEKESLPAPDNPDILIWQSTDRRAASLAFTGFASDNTIKAKEKELASLLDEKGIRHKGDFEFLGYNPPYQLFSRRNEILVTLADK